jgi:molecular chaperone DnaK
VLVEDDPALSHPIVTETLLPSVYFRDHRVQMGRVIVGRPPTNSAIAVCEDGAVTVIKNNEGVDYTPSAVCMPKADVVQVGTKAKNRALSDPDDAHTEFKLEMGMAGAERTFKRAGVSLSPTQLSAEVLKSVRADVAASGRDQPAAAVITVPAAFALHQTSATSEAAALAGLGADCPLLQEPTAAAFAYGFQEAPDRSYWMVFDFGGGTFDAAVVSKRDGELQVLNHAGDPYLGGKLIDLALVDRLFAPAVARDLGFAEFTRDNPAWRRNFALLKNAGEIAKIELSRQESTVMYVDLADGQGGTEQFEYTLTRGALEDVAAPFYTRAVNHCREALAEGSLRPGDIDRLLLVGGTTLAPGLREWLADPQRGLGIEVDHSKDATTVVAQGAAAYAGTIRSSGKAPRPSRSGEFAVDLAYKPRVTTTTPTVGGVFHGAQDIDWTRYSVALANPQGRPPFATPRIALSAGGSFVTDVSLTPDATSRFTVELTDEAGTVQPVSPDSFTITHGGDTEAPGAVLTRSLGIGMADGSFAAVLRKGASLPAETTQNYKTSIALRRSDLGAVIRIPLAEGEHPRAERNTQVGEVLITPGDVRIDLPALSDVEVTFEVDASRRVTAVAYVVAADTHFEAEIDLSDVRPPGQVELEQRLGQVEERMARLREARGSGLSTVGERLDRLDREGVLEELRRQVPQADQDLSVAASADSLLRHVESQLDAMERDLAQPDLDRELADILSSCRHLLGPDSGADTHQEYAALKAEAARVTDVAMAQRLIEHARGLYVVLLERSGQLQAMRFRALQNMHGELQPQSTADALFKQGSAAIRAGDERALAEVNDGLARLLPPDVPESDLDGGLIQGR